MGEGGGWVRQVEVATHISSALAMRCVEQLAVCIPGWVLKALALPLLYFIT
jgi:hypothetical protein